MSKKEIDNLKKITDNLLPFPETIGHSFGFKEYKMENGVAFCWYLHIDPVCGVHRWFCSKGATMPAHGHESDEWVFVYKGSVEVEIDGVKKMIKEKEWIHHPFASTHKANFITDCYCITINIPPIKELPDGN